MANNLPERFLAIIDQVPHVYSNATPNTRVRETQFDRCVIIHMAFPIGTSVLISGIITNIAEKAGLKIVDLAYRMYGASGIIVMFPSRASHDGYTHGGTAEVINDLNCLVKAWTIYDNGWVHRPNMMVWVRIYNMPLHHYAEDKAALVVSSFAVCNKFNVEKIRIDMGSLDVIVECSGRQHVPEEMVYHFDAEYSNMLTLTPYMEMSSARFSALGLNNPALSFAEVENIAEADIIAAGNGQAAPSN